MKLLKAFPHFNKSGGNKCPICLTNDDEKTILVFKRFDNFVPDKPRKGCWLWKGSTDSSGYGKMIAGSRTDGSRYFQSAHRFSYKFFNGPIPEKMVVMHTCDNPKCVNPKHLKVGTHTDNINDCIKKGRFVINKRNILNPMIGEDNPRSKINEEIVRQIRKRFSDGEKTIYIARVFKLSQTHIYQICKFLSWKHIK